MKRILAILLSAMFIFSLCACSNSTNTNSNVKATVVNKQGVTEQLTAKEILDISEANPLNFDNNYWSAKVTVTGKITKIGGTEIINGSHYNWTLTIEGGDGDWFIGDDKYNTSTVSEDFIATLNIGDTVEISGEIVSAYFGKVNISNGTISVKKK